MGPVTLVRPPMIVARWAHTTPTCPPIGLVYVASSLRQAGFEVQVIDAVGEAVSRMSPVEGQQFLAHGLTVEEIAQRIPPNSSIIGISCMFSHEWPQTRLLLNHLRERFPHTVLIAGGEHITAMPDFSLTDCAALDYCVLGEGEETMVSLADALRKPEAISSIPGIAYRENGRIQRTPNRSRIREIDEIPPPAWDLIPLQCYLDNEFGFGVNRGRSMPILATRGCPYQCTFCSNPTMWTTRWIPRSPQLLLEEMKQYLREYHVDNFDFYDLTAIVKREWILDFCQRIIDSGLRFTWQLPSGTRSEAIDSEVSRLLYKSGCRNMTYAPESGSPTVLQRIKKKISLDRMKKSMRGAIKSGLNVKANIILGFPDETHREVWQTLRFLVEMAVIGVHDMSISPFSPYPGSELFHQLHQAGKISEFSDNYFYGLATYTDLLHTVSIAKQISGHALGRYRLFGMALFYTVSYAVRPWRFVRTLWNLFRKHQESRMEMSLRDLFFRVRQPRCSAANS